MTTKAPAGVKAARIVTAPRTIDKTRKLWASILKDTPQNKHALLWFTVTNGVMREDEVPAPDVLASMLAVRPLLTMSETARRAVAAITGVWIACPSDGRPAGWETYSE